MLVTIGIVLLLVVACSLIGETALAVAGVDEDSCLAPICGFALLLSLNAGAVRLPGRAVTALIATLALIAAATVLNTRRGGLRRPPAPTGATTGIVCLTIALTCIPFAVNGRFGLIGQSVGDDLGSHYAMVASLQQGFSLPVVARSAGYPEGIHSLVAMTTAVIGDINQGFTAVMILIPLLTALVAAGMLRDERPTRRLLASTLVGLPYLTVAFFAQNAFKEMGDGLFVLGIAAALTEVTTRARSPRSAIVVGILAAGAVQVTGYPAVAWAAGGVGIWIILSLIAGRRLPRKDDIRAIAARLGWGLVGLVVPLLPTIDRVVSFDPIDAATAGNPNFLGYYFHNISAFEALGVWPIGDFRYVPTITNSFDLGVLMGAVGLLFVLCLRWWLADRRRLGVPAVLVAAGLIYAYARHTQGPYLNAKPLAAMAPLLMLVLLRPLLAAGRGRPILSLDGTVGRLVLLGFTLLAGYCTLDVLNDARVGPLQHANDLMKLRPLVRGRSTLFLPEDHYVSWELAGSKLSFVQIWSIPSAIPVTAREPAIGTPVDFNAIEPATLDHFEYVITARSEAQSEPPANWHLLAQTQWYSLYHRVGRTLPRQILPSGAMSGSVLDCHTPTGARLSHTPGIAAVRVAPIYGPGWGASNLFVLDGQSFTQRLGLPPGTYQLSLQYQSQVSMIVSSSTGQTFHVPAYLGAYAPLWRVGDVHSSGGTVTLSIRLQRPPINIAPRSAILGALVAARADSHDHEIPLSRACGRYVDWYRTA